MSALLHRQGRDAQVVIALGNIAEADSARNLCDLRNRSRGPVIEVPGFTRTCCHVLGELSDAAADRPSVMSLRHRPRAPEQDKVTESLVRVGAGTIYVKASEWREVRHVNANEEDEATSASQQCAHSTPQGAHRRLLSTKPSNRGREHKAPHYGQTNNSERFTYTPSQNKDERHQKLLFSSSRSQTSREAQ